MLRRPRAVNKAGEVGRCVPSSNPAVTRPGLAPAGVDLASIQDRPEHALPQAGDAGPVLNKFQQRCTLPSLTGRLCFQYLPTNHRRNPIREKMLGGYDRQFQAFFPIASLI
jgi:hypothetical protein